MWLAKIAEFKQSTLSQREWCRQNNLKLSTFKYWLSRSEYNPSDKKEEFELMKQVRKLDDQINDFYELGEWKGEYYYGSICSFVFIHSSL